MESCQMDYFLSRLHSPSGTAGETQPITLEKTYNLKENISFQNTPEGKLKSGHDLQRWFFVTVNRFRSGFTSLSSIVFYFHLVLPV